jgi:hypothetical protein
MLRHTGKVDNVAREGAYLCICNSVCKRMHITAQGREAVA